VQVVLLHQSRQEGQTLRQGEHHAREGARRGQVDPLSKSVQAAFVKHAYKIVADPDQLLKADGY